MACFGTWIADASYVPVTYLRGGNEHDHDNCRANNITCNETAMPIPLAVKSRVTRSWIGNYLAILPSITWKRRARSIMTRSPEGSIIIFRIDETSCYGCVSTFMSIKNCTFSSLQSSILLNITDLVPGFMSVIELHLFIPRHL